ncbi:hypothetical protein [Methanococcus maripaludis]|uniref:Uncharacterized protein n=1 Tax=Methanococcus maripaludis TaxID=39152 RepID=A0A7J9NU37_METMI|nr:hypothetical protein [Methanococcus maripaludis]MBA2850825.1 hypothetical protein [Methanococcus maripaludis]MBA2858351.1 hypothetical protein [Methanococcus maripaludis]MBP2219012.1 hypothetical protein [Methanococcus maripaludis]
MLKIKKNPKTAPDIIKSTSIVKFKLFLKISIKKFDSEVIVLPRITKNTNKLRKLNNIKIELKKCTVLPKIKFFGFEKTSKAGPFI